MSAQPRVRIGSVGVGVLGRPQDGSHVDARLQPLLAERQPLEFVEPVPVRRAVDDRVAEQVLPYTRKVDGCLDSAGGCAATSSRARYVLRVGRWIR